MWGWQSEIGENGGKCTLQPGLHGSGLQDASAEMYGWLSVIVMALAASRIWVYIRTIKGETRCVAATVNVCSWYMAEACPCTGQVCTADGSCQELPGY